MYVQIKAVFILLISFCQHTLYIFKFVIKANITLKQILKQLSWISCTTTAKNNKTHDLIEKSRANTMLI